MPDPSPTYVLTPQAYAIPILHSALHPSSTHIGLFLASSSNEITSAIPLQHINTTLSPYTELGLELATTYAESKGSKVVGLYIGHEDGKATGLGRVGEKILGKLGVGAFGAVLNNERLAAGEGALDIYLAGSPTKSIPHQANSTSSLPSPITLDPSIPPKVLKAVREGKVHQAIKDLDNHLEDSSADWLENKETIEKLKTYL